MGRELLRSRPPAGFSITGLSRGELDITDADKVMHALRQMRPSVVVNCASYTAVDKAEREIQQSFDANTHGAAAVARASEETRAHLLHISTEYVFNGFKEKPYTEEDETAPLNIYGQCKAEAERQVRLLSRHHVIVRTSWLFSAMGKNFVHSILKLAKERPQLRIVADQFGCPTPARDLVDALFEIAYQLLRGKNDGFGTFHYCGAGKASRYAFAQRILEYSRPYLKKYPELIPVSQSEFITPARRPLNCILDCCKIHRLYGIEQKAWDSGLADVITELHSRPGD